MCIRDRFNEDGSVKGVATGNMGVGKDGKPGDNFQLGMELLSLIHISEPTRPY